MNTGERLYHQLKRLTLICEDMRDTGFQWDPKRSQVLKRRWTRIRDKALGHLQGAVHSIGMPEKSLWIEKFEKPFNPGSTKDLSQFFFHWDKGLQLQPVRWTEEGKPSTDEHAITSYLRLTGSQEVRAFCKKMLEYREAVKFLGTYIVGLEEMKDEEGRLHGHFKAHGTVSGRFSCTEVPLQTIPANLRHLFQSQDGFYLCETDYSQLEIRTLAIQADAKFMRAIFDRGGDLYLETARQMFQLPNLDKKTEQGKKLRQITKVIALSSHYMAAADTVWRNMVKDPDVRKLYPNLSVRDVKKLQTSYFEVHHEIPRWWRKVIDESRKQGFYLESFSGRRIVLYGEPDGSFVTNFKNQSLGAAIANDALERIVGTFKKNGDGDRVVNQVHDSVCSEGKDGQRLKTIQELHMARELEFEGRKIYLPVETKIGTKYARVK